MKTSIFKLSLSLFLVICVYSAHSQIVFVPGYIINDKGDTLKGEVKTNKKEFDNFSKVFFKDAAGVQKNWKPAKIKGYGFDKKHFVSITENDETMFYQRLTTGAIVLYQSSFESVSMNQTIKEMAYFLWKEGDKKLTDVKEAKFKKQIQEWMSGSAAFANDYVDEKKFNVESAISIINKYNEWKKTN